MKPVPLKVFLLLLWLSRRKQRFASAESLLAAVRKDRARVDGAPPTGFARRFKLDRRVVHGSICHGMAPLNPAADSTQVLYLHGGAYCTEMSSTHWDFLADLVKATGCAVHVPLYPLAPEHSHHASWPLLHTVYRALCAAQPAQRLVLMGDSAGAGLALALAQSLLELGLPQPRDIVLISPWIDLTSSHVAAARLDGPDPWLQLPGMQAAARWWAGSSDRDAPEVSPLHGPLRGLGHMTVFIGTRDALIGECRMLRQQADTRGDGLTWVEAAGMIHVWPILPIREAAAARRQIASLVMGQRVVRERSTA